MYCKNCGHLLNSGANFCDKCGYKVDETTKADSTDFEEETLTLNSESVAVQEKTHKKPVFFKISQIVGLFGLTVFLCIVLVGLIGYGRVYFFDGYIFTAVISWICFGIMALGFLLILTSLLIQLIARNSFVKLKNVIVSAVALVLCGVLSVMLVIFYIEEKNDKDYKRKNNNNYSYNYNSGNNGYDNSDEDDLVSVYLGCSIRVNSIKKSSSGNYTYVKCTITNVSNNYGTPTRYRYVKVKGVFKNSSGDIVDTDWTYAIDSVWLEPGESKQFEFMVANSTVKSAVVTIVTE